jgi:BirA family biotin operon repressor/biotin-[acetyl-CoA-carboxylase] ligase
MNSTTKSILDLLHTRQGDVSGEDMCATLGISRAAVWKHIQTLRGLGYRIDSATHRGYRLVAEPNAPYPWAVEPHLTTHRFGRELRFESSVESTNRIAAEWAEDNVAEGATVVADAQSAGRGRMTRAWFSPEGVNLYMSVVLRPQAAPMDVPQISLLGALAVCRAVKALMTDAPDVRVKWPNDVLVGDKKLAGVLCEMKSELDRVHFVVVGIGINVNVLPASCPGEIQGLMTSLRAESGREQDRAVLAAMVLNQLEAAYDVWRSDRLATLLSELEAGSAMSGHRVAVHDGYREIRGTALGYAVDGALRIRRENGEEISVRCGDVHVLSRNLAVRE